MPFSHHFENKGPALDTYSSDRQRQSALGLDEKRLADEASTIMVSTAGFDEAISANINDRHAYHGQDIRLGHQFVNIVRAPPSNALEVTSPAFTTLNRPNKGLFKFAGLQSY